MRAGRQTDAEGRSWRGVPLLAAGLVLGLHAALAQTALDRREPLSGDWRRLQSANFVVAGNADERQLRAAVRELENFRRVFLTLWPNLALTPDVPTVLVLFRDHASFAPFRPRNERGEPVSVGGYFAGHDDVNYMVAPASADRAATFEAIFHEYTHYILRRAGGPLPRWVDEGLAQFYSTFEMEGDGRAVLGRAPRGALQALRRQPLLPLERLLTSEGSAKALRNGSEARRFYAQSWALAHCSIVGARKGQLAAYLRALERGLPVEEAFREAYKVSFAALQEELRAYVTLLQLPAASVSLPGERPLAAVTIERMLAVDALSLEGDLLTRMGSDQDAERLLTRALRIDRRHVIGRVAMAAVLRRRDRRDQALAALQAVVADAPLEFGGHYWLGVEYLHARRYEEALRSWGRALEINERSRGTWVELSVAAQALGRHAQARAAFARAQQLDRDPALYQRRAHRLFEVGLDAAIPDDVAGYVRAAGWGNESAPYMALLGALAHRRLNEAEKADALLAGAAASVDPESWTAAIVRFLQGAATAEALLQKARDLGERTEAHAYIGLQASIAGRREEALRHLTWVVEQGSRQYTEYTLARAELRRLREANHLAIE